MIRAGGGRHTNALRDPDDLLAEAEATPFAGWDFSWLEGRMTTDPLPWSYSALVGERAANARSLLDIGTGGGERLAALPNRPPLTVATEAWLPSVPVAAQRLHPLGIAVVQVEPAPDNDAQLPRERRGPLPFRDESFDLVIGRHEAFVATEVARVLTDGGHFITQQLGPGLSDALHRWLELDPPVRPKDRVPVDLALVSQQVGAAGLTVERSGRAESIMWFHDVGALAWYLKAVPWEVPTFSPTAHRGQLARLHQRIQTQGPLPVPISHLWLEALKPH
ncbi:MAG: class I SAM-dependent methyltransferase [Chloroflexi bacterium]|nr:class I SAM-dependent methyltransferase [Chloroflexota bacterium]